MYLELLRTKQGLILVWLVLLIHFVWCFGACAGLVQLISQVHKSLCKREISKGHDWFFRTFFRLGSQQYIWSFPQGGWYLLYGIKLLCPVTQNSRAQHHAFMLFNSPSQVIQKISAVDKDEPSNGHQFYFSLTTDATNNHNFSLKDNKGKVLLLSPVEAAGTDSKQQLFLAQEC